MTFHRGAHSLGDHRRLGARCVASDEEELFATPAHERVALTHGLAEQCGESHQHLIAGQVTEPVVHVLEPVEVEQEEDKISIPAPAARSLPVQDLMLSKSVARVFRHAQLQITAGPYSPACAG